MRKFLSLIFTVILACSLGICLVACNPSVEEDGYRVNPNLDLNTPVSLKIVGDKATWPALESIITKFEKKYPNCSVTYEFIQDYYSVLGTRLSGTEDRVDIFTSNNIQSYTDYAENAFNLLSRPDVLDLSETNKGLVENFRYTDAENTQYCIPVSGEMRGMYVNKTLLASCGLEVPTNVDELLHCCEVLQQHGYIPLQSSPGIFAQQLLYPYICNTIVNGGNYEEVYQSIENIDDGISEYFREPLALLYDIVQKGYYNYKEAEEVRGLNYTNSPDKARVFLNVIDKDESGNYTKKDDIGQIAFMPDTQAFQLELDRVKSNYHSEIDYEFILSPVGEDGGYAYLSPSAGLAINKNSNNIEWSLEFMYFFFRAENNKEFASLQGTIPNTSDALIKYNISADRTSNVGQVTFSYGFYNIVTAIMTGGYDDMVSISKMNAPKYLDDSSYAIKDAEYIAANPGQTYYYYTDSKYKEASAEFMSDNPSINYYILAEKKFKFTLDQYIERLEAEFQKAKQSRRV